MPLASFCKVVRIACRSNFQLRFLLQECDHEHSTANDPATTCRILGRVVFSEKAQEAQLLSWQCRVGLG